MRVEVRLKPGNEMELSAAKLIESALSMKEKTITQKGQCFWVFNSAPRASDVLKSLTSLIKTTLKANT